ncbi:MAG: hypothetical protein J0I79_02205 [Mesorhizobium sp.]|uniref:hypothetical protein n=1 Tax=Mesorhizobium sp. TaxID=1871066 RepID=UPI001AC7D72E|nr:hypothetical protein [Mesorhizobium sp.]MBN9216744.1 hypothetical protein [Mesorhizobium sp.]
MSDIQASGGMPPETTAPLGIADWLCLAAAPTFALMALLSCFENSGASMLCMGSSPLTGMAAMYLLMSAFHLAPWLRVISGRQTPQQ